ncbi:MAG TPA: hypothetical protein VFD92_05175 [Candidatus Binatia bacterium]|nr:hypothetical protein [Candidatus Binatia bacterium]
MARPPFIAHGRGRAAALACVLVALAADVPLDRPAARAAEVRPYSVQLHVHGSFSEGVGSIDSHSWEASDVGADAIWWSDHDFRIASYRHASRLDFESWSEPLSTGEPWTATRRHGEREKGIAREPTVSGAITGSSEITAEVADDGSRSLRVRGTATGDAFATRTHELVAHRGLFKRPLASGITLEISIRPEEVSEDARPIVDVDLSEHAPRDGGAIASVHLRYVLSPSAGPARLDGTIYEIPVSATPGAWKRLRLELTRDAAAGFPWMVAEDNSVVAIRLGVESRHGAPASAAFDRLAIRQERSGEAAFAHQADLLRAVGARYPRLRELQGVEISFATPHLNELSVAPHLLDYDALRAELPARAEGDDAEAQRQSFREVVARRAVAAAHARGGLVSYNHMFGAAGEDSLAKSSRDELLQELIGTHVWGADLLEVGYRDRGGHGLADQLWVWDRLAEHGLHPVGVGVSDSHGGSDQRWRTGKNNFLSWVYATAPEKPELLAGLRAGRVFFGDITLFDGAIDLTTSRGFRMGQIVVTDRPREEVRVAVTGLQVGQVVSLVVAGEPKASTAARSGSVEAAHDVELAVAGATAVRAEVRGGDGALEAASNPITFLRAPPADGLPAARAAVDLGGVRTRRIDGFVLTAASCRVGCGAASRGDAGKGAAPHARGRAVALSGRATSGAIELDVSELSAPVAVRLEGLRGHATVTAESVSLEGLAGEGSIEIASGGEGARADGHTRRPAR